MKHSVPLHLTIMLLPLLAGCGAKPMAAPPARPVMTVELVSPAREAWPEMIEASGEVAAWQEASIGTELGGVRLDEVLVNVGDAVRKHQLLARYSEDMLRVDLARLDAAVSEASALLEKATADAKRAERMAATSALSEQAIQAARTQARVAQAQLESAQAQRAAQALKLKQARVLSPDDGVISARSATAGAVSVMGGELFRLVRRGRLEWRAQVPAESFARLTPGLAATVRTAAGAELRGVLRQVAPVVDSGSRSGIAYVDLPPNSGLPAGIFLTGHFELASREALVVPESAVVLRDGSGYLMRVDQDLHVRPVKVTTGRRRGDAIEILGVIDPAARFVKSGGAFVGEGDLVKVSATVASAP